MNPPLFSVRDLRLERAGRTTLDIPALELPDHGVCAITGPNGAGKTTLLLALAQLLPLSQGSISFLGQEVGQAGLHPAQLRRQVTLVMQDPYLLSGSVGKNLAYGLALRNLPRAEIASRVRDALAAVGLQDFARRNSRALSGGERQRVALARALALSPRALLLDEPFASLDRASAAIVENIITALPTQGCAVLLVAHDQALVSRLAQHVVRLEEGRLGGNPF